jgi:Mn2+/Fe2+ NRAMP family transporter
MNRKNLPVIIMLIAGAIISVITFIREFEVIEKLILLLVTLVVFYSLGCLLVFTMNHFDKVNEQKRLDEEKKAAEEAKLAETQQQEK